MKKINFNSKKIIGFAVLIPLLSLFIIFGCQNDGNDQNTAQLNYSGEEIFRGIFFSQGDLPNHIDALKANHEQSEAAMAANKNVKEFKLDFSKEIIKEINTLDPNYFSQFKKQMESKNYFAMQLAISNALKMIKAGGYRSKYSGYFKLSDKLESKKADFTSKEFQNIDINTPDGITKYKSLIKDKYDINVDDDEYKVACSFCVVYLVAGAINTVAMFHYGVTVAMVYDKVEFWGGATNQNAVDDVLIEELAKKLGSSQGYSRNSLSY